MQAWGPFLEDGAAGPLVQTHFGSKEHKAGLSAWPDTPDTPQQDLSLERVTQG